MLQERKAKREAATKAIHEPCATPSPGVPGARFGALRKGSGVAGAFGRKGLPTRVDGGDGLETRERPATTAFGSRVRPSRPRHWSARVGDDSPDKPTRRPSWSASSSPPGDDDASSESRDESRQSAKSAFAPPFERERPGDAARRVRAFLSDRNLRGARREGGRESETRDARRDWSRRPAGFARVAGSPSSAEVSPAAPWRLLKANAAAELGAMLGELDPEKDPGKDASARPSGDGDEDPSRSISIDHSLLEVPEDPEEKYEREAKAAAARAAAAEAKARAEATSEAKRGSRATPSDPFDRAGRLSSSFSSSFKRGVPGAGTPLAAALRRPSSPVEDSAQPSPTTPREDGDAARAVRDSLEADDDGPAAFPPRRSVSHARVWREGDDVSGEDDDSEDEALTLAEARAAMAAAEREGDGRLPSASTNDSRDFVNPNLFRDSLAELPAGAASTSEAVAELVSSVNGVLDSIDTFRAIERGVGERKRGDDGGFLAGRRVADMRAGRFGMQADETGIVPEMYGALEASARGTFRETLASPEESAEARLSTSSPPSPPSSRASPPSPRPSERETDVSPPEAPETATTATRRARVAVVADVSAANAPETRETASAVVPAASIPARASPGTNSPGDIPVATPIAVTREGAMRLVRAGIPLPDAYKAVLGEAPLRRAPEAAVPAAGAHFPVSRSARPAPPPATPPTASPVVGGYAQKLEPRPAQASAKSARRRASPAVSEREKEKKEARALAERERKLEGSYAVAADEAASRRRREARRLAAIEAEARAARAEEAAAAARSRARADSARDRHNTVFAPPRLLGGRRDGGGDGAWSFATPPPSTTPRALGAKTVTPHGRRQTRVRFAETPEGRAARELLGDAPPFARNPRAPLGERFVDRMLAGDGRRAPTSLSTEEAKLLASIRRLDARRLEDGGDDNFARPNAFGPDAFASRRSVEEAALLASLARLDGELESSPKSRVPTKPGGPSTRVEEPSLRAADLPAAFPAERALRADGSAPPRGARSADSARVAPPAAFPAGVQPRPRRPAREPNRPPTRRWSPPDGDAGPVRDEWGAPPKAAAAPPRRAGPGPGAYPARRGFSAAPSGKKRMNVGYVPPSARAASARRGAHLRDSGGVISGGRVTDYFG